MGDLLPTELTSSSLSSNLSGLHGKILHAKESTGSVLTKLELKQLAVRITGMHGIKELPSKEIMALCYDSWLTKFSQKMNKEELYLAFEMNVNGDFEFKLNGEIHHRINHYQCFSREFFCDVLNQYLKEKVLVNKRISDLRNADDKKALSPPDPTPRIFEAIIADYKDFHEQGYDVFSMDKPFETHKLFPTAVKLDLLNMIYDINISEKNIIKLREHAKNIVIRNLTKKKNMFAYNKRFGVVVSVEHQLARVKAGKLLNQQDEDLIQAEVSRLLYVQSISAMKPDAGEQIEQSVFVRHVKENIDIYHKNK